LSTEIGVSLDRVTDIMILHPYLSYSKPHGCLTGVYGVYGKMLIHIFAKDYYYQYFNSNY